MHPEYNSTVLLTRPQNGATRFADALRRIMPHAVEIVVSPLSRIDWLDVQLDLDGVKALVFTSINGVDGFERVCARRDIACFAVGDATAARARAIGLNAISCNGNAAMLIAQILADGHKGPILHVRGHHSRGDVAQTLSDAGCETKERVLYRQAAVLLNSTAIALLKREKAVIVPLFSPRSAAQFVDQYAGGAPLNVVAISEEVANVARALSPARLTLASNPNAGAMLAAVKEMLDAGPCA